DPARLPAAPLVVEVVVRVGVRRCGQAGGGEGGGAGEDAAATGEAAVGLDVGMRLVLLDRRVGVEFVGTCGHGCAPESVRFRGGRPCAIAAPFISGQHHLSASALITVRLRLVATPRYFSTATLVS